VPVRYPVGQPLASDALNRERGPSCVAVTEGDPVVVSEIEFAEVTLQVLLANVVVHTIDAALEDRKVALDRVGVGIAAHVFADRMVYGAMAREALADLVIDRAL
jgi:hypothetical protein